MEKNGAIEKSRGYNELDKGARRETNKKAQEIGKRYVDRNWNRSRSLDHRQTRDFLSGCTYQTDNRSQSSILIGKIILLSRWVIKVFLGRKAKLLEL